MFYPLFSRLMPSQPLQNASHHIRYTKEIPGDKSQWSRFNYHFFFCTGQNTGLCPQFPDLHISWKCQNDGLPLKMLGGTAIVPGKHFYRLPKDWEKESTDVLLFKQNQKIFCVLLDQSTYSFYSNSSRQSCLLRCHNSQKQRKEVHR